MPELDNGNVTIQDESQVTDVVPPGSAVYFICNIGFNLYGQRKLTCENSGNLNDKAPNCTGMYKHL